MSNFPECLSDVDAIFHYVQSHSIRQILNNSAACINKSIAELKGIPIGAYNKDGSFGAYFDSLIDIKQNFDKYQWFYRRLYEEESKRVFFELLRYRLLPSLDFIKRAFDKDHVQYFDHSIIECSKEEVFVDCGGFIGDTAEKYIEQYQDYKKIYVFEPSPKNVMDCKRSLEKYPNIEIVQAGVGNKGAGKIEFSREGSASSVFHNTSKGKTDEIDIVALDDWIQEKITFLKMDIEGSEIDAIYGAAEHIKNDTPKLAICLYHMVTDFWEIPKLIDSINPNYQFYLRHYNEEQTWETVLYAVPKDTASKAVFSKPMITVISSEQYSFSKGIRDLYYLPYAYFKQYGAQITYVAKSEKMFPKSELLPNMQLDCLEEQNYEMTLCNYIKKNAFKMDTVFLYGLQNEFCSALELYRFLRPDGVVMLMIESDILGIEKFPFALEKNQRFLDQCTVIFTFSLLVQKHLMKHWKRQIEVLPSGCYQQMPSFEWEQKKDTILAICGNGTSLSYSKMVLESFAEAAQQVPDWKICFVGYVDTELSKCKNEIVSKYPELGRRILFFEEKAELPEVLQQLKNAKIYVDTQYKSKMISGIIEHATENGCTILTPKLEKLQEGFQDIVYPIENSQQLKELFLQLFEKEQTLYDSCQKSFEYALDHFSFERVVQRINLLMNLHQVE